MNIKKHLLSCAVMAAGFSITATSYSETATYTSNADFDMGVLFNVNHEPVLDELVLNVVGSTFPYLWIANAGQDSMSKINTDGNGGFGCEEARYFTSFANPAASLPSHSAFAGAAPSRTAVNADGDIYVANRNFHNKKPEVLKILTAGGIDRSGDGIIQTAEDTNGDCSIQPNEMLPVIDGYHSGTPNGVLDIDDFADERVAWITPFGSNGALGRSLCLDNDFNVWAGTYSNTPAYYKFDPNGNQIAGPINTNSSNYGCAVDGNGRLFGASLGSQMIEVDTNTNTWITNRTSGGNYGITLGNDSVYLGSTLRHYNISSNSFGPSIASSGTGVAVDGDDSVWFGTPTLRKFSTNPDGSINPTPVCSVATLGSRGPVIDSNGHAWTINLNSNSVSQYDTNCGFISTIPVGTAPYTYSDATGFSLLNFTQKTGTWTVVKDSGATDTELQSVSWTATLPTGSSVVVEVRVAATVAGLELEAYQEVLNGAPIAATVGQFIQVRTRLTANNDDESPMLLDLAIEFISSSNKPLSDSFTGKGAGSIGPLGLLIGMLLLAFKSSGRVSSAFVLAICGLVLSSAVTTTASAANNEWYYGASVGAAETDIKDSVYDADLLGLGYTATSTIDSDTLGWKLFAGYPINNIWDIEMAYVNLGKVESKTDVSSPVLLTAAEQQLFADSAVTVHPYSVDGLSLVGKANWHVNNKFSVFGKLGVFTWKADIDVDCVGCSTSVSTSDSESGTNWIAGVGALYKINNKVGVRAEYERFATDRNDIDLVSIGVQVDF